MKVCKHCGKLVDDAALRCPKCGDLFDADMDDMLREMKSNLKSYKSEVSAQRPAAAQPVQAAQPAQPAYAAPAQAGTATAQDLAMKEELARVKGELRALQGEVDRVGARGAYQQPQLPVIVQPAGMPAQQQPTVIYQTLPPVQAQPVAVTVAQQPAEQPKQPAADPRYKPGKKRPPKIRRCGSRIFIACVVLAMIGVSIGMFFLDWIKYEGASFTGFDIIRALGGQGDVFPAYLVNFTADKFLFDWLALGCEYILRYGVIAYAALLVLGLPVLFSLGGRVKFKGWHTFCAWASFICALLFFIIFLIASGFGSMTLFFLLGAGANFVRCIFLLFYKGYDHEVDINFNKQ